MAPAERNCVRIAYRNSYYLVPVDFITRVHPGGKTLILPYVNQDITQAFVDAKHSDDAVLLLERWMEGVQLEENAADTNAEGGRREPLAEQWRQQFAALYGDAAQEPTRGPSTKLWNALVFGIAGASAAAAVLCRR